MFITNYFQVYQILKFHLMGEFQLIDKKIYKELLNFDDYYPYTRGLIASLSSNTKGVDYVWQKIARKSK